VELANWLIREDVAQIAASLRSGRRAFSSVAAV
jgi:hypothetical protein